MELTILHTVQALEEIAGDWNLLLDCSASHVPFLKFEYIKTWWQTLGGGEWSHGDLYVAAARSEDRSLAGIAPLFFTTNREGEPALMFLGSIEISDYLDLIVCQDELPDFLNSLLDHLASEQAPGWRVLDWYNILESSPTLSVLEKVAQARGWQVEIQPLQHCPYIPLPGDWETYLAGIDKKQRHEIRRKMRRLEEQSLPVRWYIVEDKDQLDNEIDDFLSLMAQDPEKDRFLTDGMRAQMHASIQTAFQAGWLQLAFIEIDGQKAAGYLNFDYANHIWVYNSGLNFAFRELSPGWVLLGYLLQWANQNKRCAFDFMRGDEDYKYRFGAKDRRVMRIIVRR
jgi:CelD/BcsL family acetyltransferase involved in cellulose biosynthesis